jgi:hypothetical protein
VDQVRFLPVGDGELPVLPGVEHGVVEASHSEYDMQGVLVYTLPPGAWSIGGDEPLGRHPSEAVWHVSDIVSEPEGAVYPDDWEPSPMAGSGATISLAAAPDPLSWRAPARDSGAWTVDVPGADFVVVTRGAADAPGLARWEALVRRGELGWTVRLDFTDDATGDELARNFFGNLWFWADGEPDWFEPTFSAREIESDTAGTPPGWQETSTKELTYALPAGWTGEEMTDPLLPGVTWEGDVATTGFELADGTLEDVRWSVIVEIGYKGGFQWDAGAPGWQELDVPGADVARVRTTAGPFYADQEVRALSSEIQVHQAAAPGRNLALTVSLPDDAEGEAILRGLLGSLRFS